MNNFACIRLDVPTAICQSLELTLDAMLFNDVARLVFLEVPKLILDGVESALARASGPVAEAWPALGFPGPLRAWAVGRYQTLVEGHFVSSDHRSAVAVRRCRCCRRRRRNC